MCHGPELNGPIAICSRMNFRDRLVQANTDCCTHMHTPCCTYIQIIMHVKKTNTSPEKIRWSQFHVISSILEGLLEYYMNLEFYQRMVAMAAKGNCHVQRSLLWISRWDQTEHNYLYRALFISNYNKLMDLWRWTLFFWTSRHFLNPYICLL